MGGIIVPNTKVSGTAAVPGIPLADSPTGGLYETPSGGVGIALSGKDSFELNLLNFFLGHKPARDIALTQVAGSPFAAGVVPFAVAVSPDGAHVIINPNGGNSLSVFSLNAITGALTQVAGSPFATGVAPSCMAVSPDGAHVITGNNPAHSLSVYSFNSTTGALTPVAGSPFNNIVQPVAVAISPDGSYVLVLNSPANSLGVYSLNAITGALTPVAGSPFATGLNPSGMAISSDGAHVIVANNGATSLSVYALNAITGALTPVAGSPFANGYAPYAVAISSDGVHVIVTNNNANSLSVYSLNAITGALTPVAGSPFANGYAPYAVAISPDSSKVAISNNNIHGLSVYNLDSATGALTAVVNSPFNTGGASFGLDISPDGNNIIFANLGLSLLNVFQFYGDPTFNLIDCLFDSTGKFGGLFNVNGRLRVKGVDIPDKSLTDSLYAALAGLISQAFSAKTLTLDHAAGGLIGTPAADNAIAGAVGEYIESIVAIGAAVPLVTGVAKTVTSIALTAGDWDVDGSIGYVLDATTSITHYSESVSLADNVMGNATQSRAITTPAIVPGNANEWINGTPTVRISLAAPATIYLVAHTVFTVSTMSAYGNIRARRVR